jgi:hypothetical protein
MRPSCCETLAPLTVLSPGPRLAGMPSRGRKIWEASALATETRRDPPKRRILPQKLRLATHKPLLIWRFLALNGAFSAGLGFRKSIQERSYEFQTVEHVRSRRLTVQKHINRKPGAQITHVTYSVPHVSDTANAPTPIFHESIGIIDQTVPFTQRASARRGQLGTPQLRARSGALETYRADFISHREDAKSAKRTFEE